MLSNNLKQSFQEAIEDSCRGLRKAAVLCSGGVDSALIAKAVSQKVPKTELFAGGLPESSALASAENAAEKLQLPIAKAILSEAKLRKALPLIKKITKTDSSMQLQIALPLYFALKAAKKAGFKHVFTGTGADELFLGYDYFRREFNKRNSGAIKKLQGKKLAAFWENDFKRDRAIAKALEMQLHAPFLFPKFLQLCLSLPVKQNLRGKNDFLRKHALRELALHYGIPKEIALKRKKAAQYDSGVSKLVKKLLKCRSPSL